MKIVLPIALTLAVLSASALAEWKPRIKAVDDFSKKNKNTEDTVNRLVEDDESNTIDKRAKEERAASESKAARDGNIEHRNKLIQKEQSRNDGYKKILQTAIPQREKNVRAYLENPGSKDLKSKAQGSIQTVTKTAEALNKSNTDIYRMKVANERDADPTGWRDHPQTKVPKPYVPPPLKVNMQVDKAKLEAEKARQLAARQEAEKAKAEADARARAEEQARLARLKADADKASAAEKARISKAKDEPRKGGGGGGPTNPPGGGHGGGLDVAKHREDKLRADAVELSNRRAKAVEDFARNPTPENRQKAEAARKVLDDKVAQLNKARHDVDRIDGGPDRTPVTVKSAKDIVDRLRSQGKLASRDATTDAARGSTRTATQSSVRDSVRDSSKDTSKKSAKDSTKDSSKSAVSSAAHPAPSMSYPH